MVRSELFEVRPSPIEGSGLFAKVALRGGTVLVLFFRGRYLTARAYGKRRETERGALLQSAIHYVGDLVLYNVETHREDYINHSDTPNVLYHCGIGFALRDIRPNEELTVDYRLWLPAEDTFADKDSKELVAGLSARAMLLESTQRLLELLRRYPNAPLLPPLVD